MVTNSNGIENIASPSDEDSTSGKRTYTAIYISLGVCFIVVIAVTITMVILVRKVVSIDKERMQVLEDTVSSSSVSSSMKGSEESTFEMPLTRVQLPLGKTESDLIFQGNAKVIRLDTVTLGEVVGKGTFGIVFR